MESKILRALENYNKNFNFEKIKCAIELAEVYNGEVDEILDLIISFYPEQDTIISFLIKDRYLEGKIGDMQIRDLFGQDVLNIVMGLRKLHSLNYSETGKNGQIEVLRKMLLAMAKDLRVLVIALADRLYNVKNLYLEEDEDKRKLYARETLDIYVPIADRLGMYNIKTDLEDFSFRYTNPKNYEDITNQLKKIRKGCNLSITRIKEVLDVFFGENNIKAEVNGRIKSVYSIYKKLKKKGLSSVEDLYDIFAMRVVLPTVISPDGKQQVDFLYGVLGLIHSEWKPITKRFKDYIAVPKTNGYRSLHTVVLGLVPRDMDQPVEIQIRDEKMHRDSEYGFAAHWLYKDSSLSDEQNLQNKIEWLKALDRIREVAFDGNDNRKQSELNIFEDRIFVLTPRGEVKDLPAGSVPIDFAYAVHTDVGNKCVVAKVDGRAVSLNYELQNGEMVDIVTRSDASPKLKWLSFVKTGFAKNKIKSWFSTLNKETNLKEGRRLLNEQLEKIGMPILDQNLSILKDYLGQNLSMVKREGLVEEVGKGGKMAHNIIRKIYPYGKGVAMKISELDDTFERRSGGLGVGVGEGQVLIGGESGLPVKLSACCNPAFGDDILGYVTRGNRVSVHQSQCKLLNKLDGDRVISAHWKSVEKKDLKVRKS